MEFITLNNGEKMPLLGFGTFRIPDNKAVHKAVSEALKVGYRLIDTAHAYQTERGVGQAIKESGIAREEIFLTSKVWPTEYGEGKTLPAIDKMLSRLGTDYLDLLLLHQPYGDVVGAWKDMEKAVAQGKVKTIGISNFEKYNFDKLMDAATIKPAVMQVECHPYFQQTALREKLRKDGITLMSWYSLGGRDENGKNTLFVEPVLLKIAEAHGKTLAQVILRWQVQMGFVAIPGSVNPAHIAENFDIFDFALTAGEMTQIIALDKNARFFTAFESLPYEQLVAMLTSRELAE